MPARLARERYARSNVQHTVAHILEFRVKRSARQKLAMQYSRDVVKAIVAGRCSDPPFAMRQVFKLWRKLGLLR